MIITKDDERSRWAEEGAHDEYQNIVPTIYFLASLFLCYPREPLY